MRASPLQLPQVSGARPSIILLNSEFDVVSISRIGLIVINVCHMNEDIVIHVIGGDKAVALPIVEERDGTCCQYLVLYDPSRGEVAYSWG